MAEDNEKTKKAVNKETIKAPEAFKLPDGTEVKKGQTIVVYPKQKEADSE